MYISYRQLSLDPTPLTLCMGVRATIRLKQRGGRECELALPKSFSFDGSNVRVADVQVGSSFVVEYKGVSQEISIGRQFLVNDPSVN